MTAGEGFLDPTQQQGGIVSGDVTVGRPVRSWKAAALSDDLSATFERLKGSVRRGDLRRCEHGQVTPIIVPTWEPSARCRRCPEMGEGEGEPCLLCGNEDARYLSLELGDWVMLVRLCPECVQRQDIRPADEVDDAGEGTSVAAARLWLYLVATGRPRVAWFCTSVAYRLTVLQRLGVGGNPIVVERRVLRGPADAEWESFGPPWLDAMASLVGTYSQDWVANIPTPAGEDRELVEFVPPVRGNEPAAEGTSLVVTMLHTAGRWLVDDITWGDRSERQDV